MSTQLPKPERLPSPIALSSQKGGDRLARLRYVMRQERLGMGLRLGLIVGVGVVATLLMKAHVFWGGLLAGALVVLQSRALLRRAEQPARDLIQFLDGVRNEDLSVNVGTGRGPLLDALRDAFTDVSEAIRRMRGDREEQALYLQTIVRHIGIALLAVREDGEVALFNESAARLLGVTRPGTLAGLARRQPALAKALEDSYPGGRTLVEVEDRDVPLTLIVHTTRFQLRGSRFTLASLQDIRPELEQRETDAWRQLTRVLTHEITNSVAPIASLAATARELALEGCGAGQIDEALRVIERRCEGLVGFVEAYRSLARLPDPDFRILPAHALLGDVTSLLRATAAERGVALTCSVEPPTLDLIADPELLEQALVNVILNAIEAVASHGPGCVDVRGRVARSGRAIIEVEDNGPGLLPEVQARVFVPFFSTKAGGSGIGLSLSRQIMRLHGGSLTVRSAPEEGATFVFRF